MSGGFTAGLRRTSDPLSGSINVLASQNRTMSRVGRTIDAELFTADADGNKLCLNGQLLGKVTATGKYGPYSASATDGREVAEKIEVMVSGGVNLKDGDVSIGLLIQGSLLEARLIGLTSAARTAMIRRYTFQ